MSCPAFILSFLSPILLVGEQGRAWWLDGTEILSKLLHDLSEQLSLSELHQELLAWLCVCNNSYRDFPLVLDFTGRIF